MIITSADNLKIKELSALIKNHKRRKGSGLAAAEGKKIFLEADKKAVKAVFVSESFAEKEEELLSGTDAVIVRDSLFERVSDTKTPQGIITVIKTPEYTLSDLLSADEPFIMVLEGIRDPGNAGSIFRTAEGAGADGILLSSDCADIFSPKTIRSAMGSVFRVPFVITDDIVSDVRRLKSHGVSAYAAHLQGSIDYREAALTKASAMMIGNEARGLSGELSEEADIRIRIPMQGKLESLNAAAAAAILMYEAYSQRNKSN